MIIAPLLFTTTARKVGQFIALRDCDEGDDIEVFKDGISLTTVSSIALSYILFTPVFKYIPLSGGTYKFRRNVGGELSDFSSETNVEAFMIQAPGVSSITGTVGVNLTITNVQVGDNVKVYRSNTVGSVDTLTVLGTTINYAPPAPGTYSFKVVRGVDESAFSADVVVASANNQLAEIAITSIGQKYVNDSCEVTGVATGATLAIRFNNLPTTAGTEYEILQNGYVKFLKAGDFQFWQTKPSYVDSAKITITIASGVKPSLPTPTLSSNNVLVNATVTITNYASYDSVELRKGQSGAVLGGDYTQIGAVVTFKNVGVYRVKGYKFNYNDSELSATIDVVDIGTTQTEKTIEIGFDDLGGNKIADLEFGFSDSAVAGNASPITWYNAFESGVTANIPYVKIKTVENLTVASLVYSRVKNEVGTLSEGKLIS
jgi:hypothetical protein